MPAPQKGVMGWFHRFLKRLPREDEYATISIPEADFVRIGEVDRLAYVIEGVDEAFIHQFNKHDRPLLYISLDGRTFLAAQGRYRFGINGFEG